MRIPLTSVYTPPKDDRKVIMFIDDIFHSKWHPALKPVKELLDTEYRCITILNHRDCVAKFIRETLENCKG